MVTERTATAIAPEVSRISSGIANVCVWLADGLVGKMIIVSATDFTYFRGWKDCWICSVRAVGEIVE